MKTSTTLSEFFHTVRTRARVLSLSLTCALVALAAPEIHPAPQANPIPAAQAPLKVRTELVRMDVRVTDARGDFIGELARRNFRVLEDGVERRITFFASIEAPAEVLLLVETSPAVYLIHRQHLEAAYVLLEGLATEDHVALATYADSARVLLPFTDDKAALSSALAHLEYSLGMGELNLFGALSTALDWLAPVPGKKAIVLLSTGLDPSPPDRWDVLTAKFRSSEVTVFPVALGGSLRDFEKKGSKALARLKATTPARREPQTASLSENVSISEERARPSFAQADRVLEWLARVTGGIVYFPMGAGDFPVIYRQIAAALRHQYTLGFEPAARDGRLHKVEVQVLDADGRLLAPTGAKKGYRVYAREAFLSPAP